MEKAQIKVNLGSGPRAVNGWVNVDGALGARLHKNPVFRALNGYFRITHSTWDKDIVLHDLRRPLPWPDGTVAFVYTSHTLEHLTREDGQRIISECHRVLAPGGVLRVVVPDLECQVRRYMERHIPAERFVEELGVLYGVGKSGLKRLIAPIVEFPHQCMYDHSAMIRACEAAGFAAASRAPFESAIPRIKDIELPERTENAVIVEAVKHS